MILRMRSISMISSPGFGTTTGPLIFAKNPLFSAGIAAGAAVVDVITGEPLAVVAATVVVDAAGAAAGAEVRLST